MIDVITLVVREVEVAIVLVCMYLAIPDVEVGKIKIEAALLWLMRISDVEVGKVKVEVVLLPLLMGILDVEVGKKVEIVSPCTWL